MIKVVDRDGNEQAVATRESTENDLYWEVIHNTVQIEKMSPPNHVTGQSILQSTNSKIYKNCSKPEDMVIFQHIDKSEPEVAAINYYRGPVVKLELRKKT